MLELFNSVGKNPFFKNTAVQQNRILMTWNRINTSKNLTQYINTQKSIISDDVKVCNVLYTLSDFKAEIFITTLKHISVN